MYLINESLVFYSNNLREILNNMSHPFAKRLLAIEGTDPGKSDITFIDFEGSSFTYSALKNADKEFLKKLMNAIEYKQKFKLDKKRESELDGSLYKSVANDHFGGKFPKKGRNSIKIGRFMNMMLGDNHPNDIQAFVDEFKALEKKEFYDIEVVEGEMIKECYKEEKYVKMSGVLGKSCMNYNNNGWFKQCFQIYSDNVDSCKMVLLKEKKSDKIAARALLWIDDQNNLILDRVYYIEEYHDIILKNWALNNGYYYSAAVPCCLDTRNFTYSLDGSIITEQKTFTIKVKHKLYDYYPFVDTFSYYDPLGGILTNRGLSTGRYLRLNSIGGSSCDMRDESFIKEFDELYGIPSRTRRIITSIKGFFNR